MKKHPVLKFLNNASLRDFCRRKGLCYSSMIGLLHRNRNPSFKMILRIWKATGKQVTPQELFEWHWESYLKKISSKVSR